MTRTLTAVLLLSAWGCSSGGEPDAGVDAGRGRDAGPPSDAGLPPGDNACEFSAGCDGGLCTVLQLEDGGRSRRCVAAGACDVVRSAGCGAGLKCDYRDGGRACVPEGALAEGADCATLGDGCGRGLTCVVQPQADGGAQAVCSRFCRLASDCASAAEACLTTLLLPGVLELPLVCASAPRSCDPLLQDCPRAAEGCYPSLDTPACFPAGASDAGCQFTNDCAKGSTCAAASTGGPAACRALCRYPSGAPACAKGLCTRLSNSMTVGVCL
jgi:hypothetical protein